jgi:phage gpG-like protein
MAGAAFRVRGDDEKVKRLIRKLDDAATRRFRAELNTVMGTAAVGLVQDCFRFSRDPYGRRYKPLKYRKGQPLRDTNRLMNSTSRSATSASFVISTNVAYGSFHQQGTRFIPQRMYLPDSRRGLPASWRASLFRVAKAHVYGVMNGPL